MQTTVTQPGGKKRNEQAIRDGARSLEVQRIVLALEGRGMHPGVTQMEGTRHWPAVCAAVEKALRKYVEPLALDVGGDGKTALDEAILSIVNAIPREGRTSPAVQPTDEQIDELDKRLR